MTGPALDPLNHGGALVGAYVTASVADQLFGIAIEDVHDVFTLGEVTPVPLAPISVLGLLNLRGRVVTAIDLRRRLGLRDADSTDPRPAGRMAIGMEAERQSYCIVVDAIGEIVRVPPGGLEPNPIHLDPAWSSLSCGVHRLPEQLLVTLNVPAVLSVASGPSRQPS